MQPSRNDVPLPRLYTIPEVMEILGLKSRDSIYRLISSGDLLPTDVAAKGSTRPRTRISQQSLAAFIEKRTQSARTGAAS